MHAARLRPEILCEEMPAPQRIAPWASALSADVTVDDIDVGTGRIILLHDPAGNDAWSGTFRCVAYARAEVDLELITDPMLAMVGWTWLTEALDEHGASYVAASGTVTRVATESFGGMADEGGTAQIEIRASWTPVTPEDAPDLAPLDLAPARRGLGRAAVHLRRAAAGARRRGRDAQPPRPAGRRTLNRCPTTKSTTTAPPSRRPSRRRCSPCATACRRSIETAAGAGRDVRAARRRHRPGRHRRRARVRLPLLLARLPDPAAPRGRRLVHGRPDRLRVPRAAAGSARGHRVDPARRHPGPALPQRGRAATPPRSSTPSSPAGCSATRASAWRRWSRRCSASGSPRSTPPSTGRRGRCPCRGWSTPRSTSRCSSSCATCWPPSSSRPARTSGRARSSTTCAASCPPYASTPGAVRPGCTGCAVGARSAAVRELWETRNEIAEQRDVTPGRILPDSAIVAAAHGAADRPRRADGDQGLPRPRRRPLRRRAGSPRCARAAELDEDDLPTRVPARRRPAAAARLGREGPGRRPPARARPRGADRPRRGAAPPGRERAHPRLPAPHALDPAVDARPRGARRRGRRPARRVRRPPVADRARRPGPGRRDPHRRRGARGRCRWCRSRTTPTSSPTPRPEPREPGSGDQLDRDAPAVRGAGRERSDRRPGSREEHREEDPAPPSVVDGRRGDQGGRDHRRPASSRSG